MPSPEPAAILIVANPVAGDFSQRRLTRLATALAGHGLGCDIRLTDHAGHLTAIAANLPPTVRTLVVGGGDGSINEALVGLMGRAATDLPALAILPFGTANVLAHEIGAPFSPKRLADRIAAGTRQALHLGAIGERPFALMVSAGFDADVVHAVDGVSKRRWGKLAYVLAALRLAARQGGRDVVVEADGDTIVCRLAVVTTARHYGGPYVLSRATRATEPGLRLVTLADDRPLTLLKAAIALGLGRLDRLAAATDRPVGVARLGGAGVQMQIDGDRMATADAVIRAGRVIDVIG